MNLDARVFTVNRGANFQLNQILRGSALVELMEPDGCPRMPLPIDTCPAGAIPPPTDPCLAGSILHPGVTRHRDPNQLCGDRHKFQEFTRSFCVAKSQLDPRSVGVHSQIFLTLTFVALTTRYRSALKTFVLEWYPNDFVFREFAFAILSLASGQVLFHSFPQQNCYPSYCTGHDFFKHAMSLGYISVRDPELGLHGSTVLPEFATGTHRPGEVGGSAPLETMYWFEDVVVSLATFIHHVEVHDAIIAKTAKFGIQSGRKNFQAVILSLLDCILFEVQVVNEKTVIKHTQVIELIPLWPDSSLSTGPKPRPGVNEDGTVPRSCSPYILDSGSGFSALDRLNLLFPGFISLVHFFETAANRRLGPSSTENYGRLPSDVYMRIIDLADDETYLSFAKICQFFRTYCKKAMRLGGGRGLIQHQDPHIFTFINRMTGYVAKYKPYMLDEGSSIPRFNLSPSVGMFGRPSIINNLRLVFQEVTWVPDLTGGEVKMDSDSGHDYTPITEAT